MTAATPDQTGEPFSRTVVRRLVLLGAVVVAVGLLALAAFSADTEDDGAAVSGEMVEALNPAASSSVPQQSAVSIDLASGWTGQLTINDTAVPDDEITRNDALNIIEFQPGDDKVIEQLRAGQNCATATVWPIAEGPGGSSERPIVWCWQVV